jgi:hypothetical protein
MHGSVTMSGKICLSCKKFENEKEIKRWQRIYWQETRHDDSRKLILGVEKFQKPSICFYVVTTAKICSHYLWHYRRRLILGISEFPFLGVSLLMITNPLGNSFSITPRCLDILFISCCGKSPGILKNPGRATHTDFKILWNEAQNWHTLEVWQPSTVVASAPTLPQSSAYTASLKHLFQARWMLVYGYLIIFSQTTDIARSVNVKIDNKQCWLFFLLSVTCV